MRRYIFRNGDITVESSIKLPNSTTKHHDDEMTVLVILDRANAVPSEPDKPQKNGSKANAK